MSVPCPRMDDFIDQLLTTHAIEPVLVDIGSSGGTPRIWQPIRTHSTYIGFDGDTRDIRHPQEDEFRAARFVHEVITADGIDGAASATDRATREVTFYLTRSPYCSSTLKPNPIVTDNFLSADSFIIERQEQLKASSLSDVMDRLALPRIDWMKIDTQGTDLRIYDSLRLDLRNKMLAIDIEPGLRGAYVGEDLFSDVQKRLTKDGFWLSNLKVCGLARMRKSTLDTLTARDPSLSADVISKSLRQTPGWTECRYLRSLESLANLGGQPRDYLLLWVFAVIDKQFGFALDLAIDFNRRFPAETAGGRIEAESIRLLQAARDVAFAPKNAPNPGLLARIKRKVKRLLSSGRASV